MLLQDLEGARARRIMTEWPVLKAAGRLTSWVTPAGACFAAFLIVVNDISAEQGLGGIKVQGGWAYTTRVRESGTEYLASIRAAEGSTWLLLACRPDKQLTVSLIHTEQFPFPLKPSSSVPIAIDSVPTLSIEGKSIQSNLIFVNPWPLRHVMPSIVQDEQLMLSIPDQNGTLHNYTFPMQPNDLALKPIRSGCFDY
jgi:hypothetical protein